jgi:hypothetical protein
VRRATDIFVFERDLAGSAATPKAGKRDARDDSFEPRLQCATLVVPAQGFWKTKKHVVKDILCVGA